MAKVEIRAHVDTLIAADKENADPFVCTKAKVHQCREGSGYIGASH